jgi:hypothetical protein
MKQYKNTKQTIQNTVNTSTHITETPTHPHITKQVKTTTVQDTHQMKYSCRQPDEGYNLQPKHVNKQMCLDI